MESAAHILVSGVVQGVGYRYFVLRSARELGLKGSVRNLYGGGVELEVEGERGLIEDFIKDLWIGPHAAHVKNVQVKWHDPKGKFLDFDLTF
jgi:acylphosphatase